MHQPADGPPFDPESGRPDADPPGGWASPPPHRPPSTSPEGDGAFPVPPTLAGPGEPPTRPAWSPPPAPPRRRRPLLVAAALVGVLLLVGGVTAGTWWLVRDPAVGADTPEVAVESFLHAVYRDLDPTAAASLVCSQARDETSLATKVNEIRTYQETELGPRFQWSRPTVVEQAEEVTTVEVTVTLTTRDERVADQHLWVSVLDRGDRGWWVCDVTAVESRTGTEADPDAPAEADAEADATDDTDGSSDDHGSDTDGGE